MQKKDMQVFIGYDSRFPEPAEVLKYSIEKRTSSPVSIQFLIKNELDFDYQIDEGCSTEFTHSRFLVPHLCNYEGTALFLDNDILCLGDIAELEQFDMEHFAIRCVWHWQQIYTKLKMYGTKQVPYERKNWASVMLLNCARLKQWTKHYVENTPGIDLLQFKNVPDKEIGRLPHEWNELVETREDTVLRHYTEGGPWFKEYCNCSDANLWYREYYDWKHNR